MKNTVRIIGGRYRGKNITFIPEQHLRPTPNRVRETVFNWLRPHLPNAVCLDAFAGSGALGIEALSQGAANVVLIEANPRVFEQLQRTATALQSLSLQVIHADFIAWLAHTSTSFNIIFLDPPFSGHQLSTCIRHIEINSLLAPNGFLYIEFERHTPPTLSEQWKTHKLQYAGQVGYGLYTRDPSKC